jgi:hypothetical protein
VPIAYEVKGGVGDKLIEPMLLLPLVETCFKHGLPHIAIDLEVRRPPNSDSAPATPSAKYP